MARDDGKPMGITELRKRWPNQYAIGAMIKVPDGGYVSLSTDVPPDLAREIMGKLSWHIGGHDWKKWTPDHWVVPIAGASTDQQRMLPVEESCCDSPHNRLHRLDCKKHHSFSGGNDEPKT